MGSFYSNDEDIHQDFVCGTHMRKLKTTNKNNLELNERNIDNFINAYFRQIETKFNYIIIDDIQTIIIKYCSFDDEILLMIWDTSGQERFGCNALAPIYYRETDAAVIVYDITDRSSFIKLAIWIDELRKFSGKDVLIVIAANKIDLEATQPITNNEAQMYAQQINAKLVHVSAKTGKGIHKLFMTVSTDFVEKTANTEKFKIIFLGEARVGKTSIIHRYINDVFNEKQQSTLTYTGSYREKRIIVPGSLKRFIGSISFNKGYNDKNNDNNSVSMSYVYSLYEGFKKQWNGS